MSAPTPAQIREYGSAAERASASVYLEEFVRKDDYIRNRHQRYQQMLPI